MGNSYYTQMYVYWWPVRDRSQDGPFPGVRRLDHAHGGHALCVRFSNDFARGHRRTRVARAQRGPEAPLHVAYEIFGRRIILPQIASLPG